MSTDTPKGSFSIDYQLPDGPRVRVDTERDMLHLLFILVNRGQITPEDALSAFRFDDEKPEGEG